MGKFLARFRNPYSTTASSSSSSSPTTIATEAQANMNHASSIASKNQQVYHNSKPNKGAIKLKEKKCFPMFQSVLNVASAASNNACLFGLDDFSLQIFDYTNDRKIKNWKGHEKDITKVLYCSKIDRYMSASRDRTVKLWAMSSEQCELNLQGHELVVTAIAVDPDNKFLISGSRDNCMKLWDLKCAKLVTSAQVSRNLITDVCWSSDAKILVQTSEDKETRLWDPYNLKVIYSFPKKQYIQSSCHMSSDNNYAITTSNGFQGNGCEITVWDMRKRSLLAELLGHEQTVTCAKVTSSDRFILSSSNDSTVKLWDLKSLSKYKSIKQK